MNYHSCGTNDSEIATWSWILGTVITCNYCSTACQYLCCHDQLVVDNVIRCEAHPKESTGWVEMARHSRTAVHIFTNTLKREGECVNKYMHVHISLAILSVRPWAWLPGGSRRSRCTSWRCPTHSRRTPGGDLAGPWCPSAAGEPPSPDGGQRNGRDSLYQKYS